MTFSLLTHTTSHDLPNKFCPWGSSPLCQPEAQTEFQRFAEVTIGDEQMSFHQSFAKALKRVTYLFMLGLQRAANPLLLQKNEKLSRTDF